MNYVKPWAAVVLLAASVLIASCAKASEATPVVAATLETSDGTGIARLILTADAAERLGVETAPVRSEDVTRTRLFGAEVVARPAGTATRSGWWVRVDLTEGELGTIDPALPGLVFPLDDEPDSSGLTARPAQPDPGGRRASDGVLYTVTSGTRLSPGTRVLIELPQAGTERLIVPYSSVVYDPQGQTWTYTNPEPLVFTRVQITIEYVAGEEAILSDGPPPGTLVVTVGTAELSGFENGVG